MMGHDRIVSTLATVYGSLMCLWDSNVKYSHPSNSWNNSSVRHLQGICPAASARRHLFMSPPYQIGSFMVTSMTPGQSCNRFSSSEKNLNILVQQTANPLYTYDINTKTSPDRMHILWSILYICGCICMRIHNSRPGLVTTILVITIWIYRCRICLAGGTTREMLIPRYQYSDPNIYRTRTWSTTLSYLLSHK